jgi:CHC2-type zinc finger protein
MIIELKKQIDLSDLVQTSGIELDRNGMGLCPFHTEKTPSFKVYPDNHFKCFSCQEYGDVIDFIQKLYGLSFKEALKHLGIKQGKLTPELKAQTRRRKIERQKVEAKKQFKADLQNTFLLLISGTKKAVKNFKTIDDFEKYGGILQPLSYWEYCCDLISYGSKEEQELVCNQFKDMPVVPVKSFFKPGYDYKKLIDDFMEKRDADDEWEISLHFEGRETSCAEAPTSG